jgi:hypothetical protein
LKALATALLCALALAACGGDSESGPSREGAEKAGSDKAATTPKAATAPKEAKAPKEATADPSAGDEIDARAAVEALFLGVKGKDPRVLCGIFTERFAQEVTGAEELGVVQCLEQADDQLLGELRTTLDGVSIEQTTVETGGRSASVELSNGNVVELEYEGNRFLIDQL